MSRSRGWSERCPLRETLSTSCSVPTCAMPACCAAGSRKSARHKQKRPRTSGRRALTSWPDADDLGGVLVVVGGFRDRARSTRKRKRVALIERADATLVEASFLHLQIGAVQRVRRQLLDRKTDRFGRGAKATISEAGTLLLADRGGEKFSGSVEVERTHRTHGR